MTRFSRTCATAALGLVLIAGCGRNQDDASSTGRGGSAGAAVAGEAPVLRVRFTGGLVDASRQVTQLPAISVYADGRVITPAPQILIYPGPAMSALQVQQIDPAAVNALVTRAIAAGVRSGADLGQPGVADAPSTRFTVVTAEGTQTVDVVALAEARADDPALTVTQHAARTKLSTLLRELTDLPRTLGTAAAAQSQPYAPTSVAAIARPFTPAADPATGTPKAVAWPGPALPGAALSAGSQVRCVVVTGDALAPLLVAVKAANANTPWTSAGKKWSVALRPMLPEESDCTDLTVTQ
jgi:hypothetical protein